jgi:hypothetical protein
MAAFFFASPIDVDIRLEGEDGRKQIEAKTEKEKVASCPVYYDGDSVSGTVSSLYRISIMVVLLKRFCRFLYMYVTERR